MITSEKNQTISFEEIIGNLEIFYALLGGFLKEAGGVFHVAIPGESTSNLRTERYTSSAFCNKIQATDEGHEFCLQSDFQLIEEAAKLQKPVSAPCHAGAVLVAAPIVVAGTVIATIVWGQGRYELGEVGEFLARRIYETADRLDIPADELLVLKSQLKPLSSTDIDDIKSRLGQIANFVAGIGEQRLQLNEALDKLTKIEEESVTIQSIIEVLGSPANISSFWSKLEEVLQRICTAIGASCGVLLASEGPDDEIFRVRSVAGLKRYPEPDQTYDNSDVLIQSIINKSGHVVIAYENAIGSRLCNDIMLASSQGTCTKIGLIRFQLDNNKGKKAVLAFFVNRHDDTLKSLPIDDELPILERVAPQIANAYQNWQLFEQQEELARERGRWLRMVGHELITPLSALTVNSDRLIRYYEIWDNERITKQLKAIQNISVWAIRLFHNFDWTVRTKSVTGGNLNKRWVGLKGILIGCAIDVQGLAADKGVKVHVDEDIDDTWEIRVDYMTFQMAIGNIIDNAVKYCANNTEVRISVSLHEHMVSISVLNQGIPIKVDEIRKIFDEYYRTETAKRKVAVGTGIGLSVAQDIMRLHDGEILVESVPIDSRFWLHEVRFSIRLPRWAFHRRAL